MSIHTCGINEEMCANIDGTNYAGIRGIKCHSCTENGCNSGSSLSQSKFIFAFIISIWLAAKVGS